MKSKIQKYLKQIETDKKIKILLACETGSRAWGFPSPDSDYDIRIVYVHDVDWYISVSERKDSIEMMLENNDIDISGWELKKSLTLLKKSNPALLERIQSPIIYSADQDFLMDIQLLANQCYSKIATMHHYLSMSRKMMKEVNEKEEFKLKKFFYALRTATLCKWIIDNDEIPPIEFNKAYRHLNLEASIIQRIDELITLKSDKSEAYLHKDEPELISFINQCLNEAVEKKNSLPTGKCTSGNLNLLLRKYVHQYDN